MNKEDLIQFLRDNLKIEVDSETRYQYDGYSYDTVKIKLLISEEEISECSFYINK